MNGIWALEPYDLGPWTLREWFGCVHSDFGLSDSEFEGFRTALLECFLFFCNELVCVFLQLVTAVSFFARISLCYNELAFYITFGVV